MFHVESTNPHNRILYARRTLPDGTLHDFWFEMEDVTAGGETQTALVVNRAIRKPGQAPTFTRVLSFNLDGTVSANVHS